jgi:ubiquinone/menaquinone biosynthesis C-methylase UbiE
MPIESDRNYSTFYNKQDTMKVYPTEFVIRSFLGSYPNLKIDQTALKGKAILELGFGDGRNMALLNDLGLKICGIEVAQEICDVAVARMAQNNIQLEARVGRNSQIPYSDASFDHLLACNSCYYVDPGQTYNDNLREIARVIRSGGLFIHSLPMPSTFIMDDAKDLGDGHMQVTKDPYGIRVGDILKKFDSPKEIERYLSPSFKDIRIGSIQGDYWGSKVHLWLVVCTRR